MTATWIDFDTGQPITGVVTFDWWHLPGFQWHWSPLP